MGEWSGLVVVSFMNFQPCFNSLKSKNINSAVREDSIYLFTVNFADYSGYTHSLTALKV